MLNFRFYGCVLSQRKRRPMLSTIPLPLVKFWVLETSKGLTMIFGVYKWTMRLWKAQVTQQRKPHRNSEVSTV